jgi:hypothetical protein
VLQLEATAESYPSIFGATRLILDELPPICIVRRQDSKCDENFHFGFGALRFCLRVGKYQLCVKATLVSFNILDLFKLAIKRG